MFVYKLIVDMLIEKENKCFVKKKKKKVDLFIMGKYSIMYVWNLFFVIKGYYLIIL